VFVRRRGTVWHENTPCYTKQTLTSCTCWQGSVQLKKNALQQCGLSSDDALVAVLINADRMFSGVTLVPHGDLNVKKSSSLSDDAASSAIAYINL
jgi:hypothetical protein